MNIPQFKKFLDSTTAKLGATYLGLIMLMSISFSIILYQISSQQLGRQLPPQSLFNNINTSQFSSDYTDGFIRRDESRREVNNFLQGRIEEGRHELIARLVALNLLVLISGGAISYYLARRTLTPIEDAMEAQSQFVSDASHELRTPLTALQTTNEVALRKKKLTIAEAKDLIGYNIEETIKLKALTDALLGLLQQDATPITLSSVPLQRVTMQAMNMVVQSALAKDIAVEDTIPDINVYANEQALAQVFTILLDNAVKYSPKGTTITLAATAKQRQAVITVRDQGIGIKASDLAHIFRRFYRADKARTSHQEHGYGLGLAIAEKIIKEHDGSIAVTSQLDVGTTFTITLPLA